MNSGEGKLFEKNKFQHNADLEIALKEFGKGPFLTARIIGFQDWLGSHDFRYEAQEPRHAIERNSLGNQ